MAPPEDHPPGDEMHAADAQPAVRTLATLVLEKIECEATDDLASDEPIITVNGNEVWRATDVDIGDVRTIGVRHAFVNVAVVRLLEAEFTADHDLGAKIIDSSDAGLGRRLAFFNTNGARYILEYHVE